MRLPYQILVFPFAKEGNKHYYALFKRKDLDVWQAIAGGGEKGENPLDTAKREACEEASIDKSRNYIRLTSLSTTPAPKICGLKWGKETIMVFEFSFGVELSSREEVKIGSEHIECRWFNYKEALSALKWDSNKAALWELNYRLENNSINGAEKNIQVIKRFL